MKKGLLMLCFFFMGLGMSVIFPEHIQLHYDFGRRKKVPVTSTVEMFKPDKCGEYILSLLILIMVSDERNVTNGVSICIF